MSKLLLDEILLKYNALTPEQQREIDKMVAQETGHLKFIPNPGPQTDAYNSQADLLLYGGAAGGGKSQLLLGLAMSQHRKSLLMRRSYADLSDFIGESIKMNGTRKGYNGSNPPKLVIDPNHIIQFGAVNEDGDEQKWQGRARDLLGLDEAAQFLENQVRFLMGWVRSTHPGQRCRTVLASNPPVLGQGDWMIPMFAPWLDPFYYKPAKAGELRWFITDEGPDGKPMDIEVDGQHVEIKDKTGQVLIPTSRTFISAKLEDNPYLIHTDYLAKLSAMPEPYRSAMRDGNFMIERKDQDGQLIPSSWVRAAMDRWKEHPKPPRDVPQCAIGVDIAHGGKDNTVLAIRYDGWFAPLIVVKGVDTPNGRAVAGLVVSHRKDASKVIIDMGGGYGGDTFQTLKDNEVEVYPYKGLMATKQRTVTRQLGFTNKRSAAYWMFREALDPDQPGGSPIFLPDDPGLFADLTAPTFEVVPRGIKVEAKEEVVSRLKRSTDKGDAVIMSWSEGQKALTDADSWKTRGGNRNSRPQVNMGHSNRRRK